MAKAGPKKIQRYSNEFKLTVVKLSHMKGVLVGDVAKTFDIHPWMLSRWRTDVKNRLISGKTEDLPNKKKVKQVELRQLREARVARQEERRVGKGCVSKCRNRCLPDQL